VKAHKFETLIAQLSSLNQPQRLQLLAVLHPAAGIDRVVALIAEIRAPLRRCPDCSCERCHRHGQANHLQRFCCCQCGRTFNDLTGTPLARLRHKGKWRHRFLNWVKYDRPPQLTGIVEADETFLLESQKGSRKLGRAPRKRGGKAALPAISRYLDCILVARDRSGQTIDAVTGRGSLKKSHLVEHLLPKLCSQALLVTDGNAAYQAFAREHAIAHQAVNLQAGERVRASSQGAIHIQNVNAYHRRFKEWLARFHGVASWRLPNYLGWHWALDGGRIPSVEQLLRIAIGFIHSER